MYYEQVNLCMQQVRHMKPHRKITKDKQRNNSDFKNLATLKPGKMF